MLAHLIKASKNYFYTTVLFNKSISFNPRGITYIIYCGFGKRKYDNYNYMLKFLLSQIYTHLAKNFEINI